MNKAERVVTRREKEVSGPFLKARKGLFHLCVYFWKGTMKPSLRIQPILLAPRRYGCFARKNICASATEIPYWWRKICPESGQELWLVDIIVILFYLMFSTDRKKKKNKRPQRSNVNGVVNGMNLLQNGQYSWNIFLLRKSIWVLLELIRRRTQNFTIINQEKHKIKQIYIWNPMTNWFIM